MGRLSRKLLTGVAAVGVAALMITGCGSSDLAARGFRHRARRNQDDFVWRTADDMCCGLLGTNLQRGLSRCKVTAGLNFD